MYVIKIKQLLIFILIICLLIILGFFIKSNKKFETMSTSINNVIVIDAGHGLPDGGAESNGIIESNLNLIIAKKLEENLLDLGYKVIMTRNDENNIADSDKQSPVSKMKQSDLNNRVKLINESNADFAISIHLNKYSSPKYWGWQTFYNENSKAR